MLSNDTTAVSCTLPSSKQSPTQLDKDDEAQAADDTESREKEKIPLTKFLDSRIRERLDTLNYLAERINKLENQLDEANNTFGIILKDSTDKLRTIAQTLGKRSIKHARDYHEAKIKTEKTQIECQQACLMFEQANSTLVQAKKAIAIAESRLKACPSTSFYDTTTTNCSSTSDAQINNNNIPICTNISMNSSLQNTALSDSSSGDNSDNVTRGNFNLNCLSKSLDNIINEAVSKNINDCLVTKTSSGSQDKQYYAQGIINDEYFDQLDRSPSLSSSLTNFQHNNTTIVRANHHHHKVSKTLITDTNTDSGVDDQVEHIELIQDPDFNQDRRMLRRDDVTCRTEELNLALMMLIKAEKFKDESQVRHQETANKLIVAQRQLSVLEREYKTAIRKSKPYFDESKRLNAKLSAAKSVVDKLSEEILEAKSLYSRALRELESLSTEMHHKRGLMTKTTTTVLNDNKILDTQT